MTTIGFVSTTVLESKDGIDFGDETRIESEEVNEAEKRALEAARRPLWEQLQEREDRKAEEFESVRKAIFAPPKKLDEDDVEFLETLEQNKKSLKAKEKELERQELDAFSSARAAQTIVSRTEQFIKPIVGVTSKQGIDTSDQNKSFSVGIKRRKNISRGKKEKKIRYNCENNEETQGQQILLGLVGYSSDNSS